MIAVTLVLAFIGTLGLFVHLVAVGEFVEALKAFVTASGVFALLAARVTFYRVSHGQR